MVLKLAPVTLPELSTEKLEPSLIPSELIQTPDSDVLVDSAFDQLAKLSPPL